MKDLQSRYERLRAKNAKRGKLDGTEIEDIQAKYHQEARKELESKLAQVSEFLAQQSIQSEKLEQLRAENSMHEKQLSGWARKDYLWNYNCYSPVHVTFIRISFSGLGNFPTF